MAKKMLVHILVLILVVSVVWDQAQHAVDVNIAKDLEVQCASALVSHVQSFPFSDVRLMEGIFQERQEATRRYLESLDIDRLLRNFRLEAGLEATGEPYGGWEEPRHTIRGCFLGHYLSACALMYASTGNETMKQRVNTLVTELARCQEAADDGYVAGFSQKTFDELEQGLWPPGTPMSPVPWYKMHKTMAGLRDAYIYAGNPQALLILERLAEWAKNRTDRLSPEKMNEIIRVEFGGMNEVLFDLYGITGKPDYLTLARRFEDEWLYKPLAEHRDNMAPLHANTTIPKIVGSARRYELLGQQRYRDIAEFFWQEVALGRSYATGGTSRIEGFQTFPGMLANELDTSTEEFCCTYNMLKLTKHLFTWTADPRYADYYERALVNHILAIQNPANGMIDDKISLSAGDTKHFCSPEGTFNCCLGTACEMFSKLAEGIYFHADSELYINQFVPSELKWTEHGLRLRQETQLPLESKTRFKLDLDKPVELTLCLRIPSWTRKSVLSINGQVSDMSANRGGYVAIRRTWNSGDIVELDLPMHLYTEAMPDDPTFMAIKYGPVLLAAVAQGDQPKHVFEKEGQPFLRQRCLSGNTKNISSWLKPTGNKPFPLKTSGQQPDLTFIPLYEVLEQPYGVYWRVYDPSGSDYAQYCALEKKWEARRLRVMDEVEIMEMSDKAKSDAGHHLETRNCYYGQREGRGWINTREGGGWFSYQLLVSGDQTTLLACTFWVSQPGHLYDILIDGQKLVSLQTDDTPCGFFDVEQEIPRQWIQGKSRVTVRFEDRPESGDGALFACAIILLN